MEGDELLFGDCGNRFAAELAIESATATEEYSEKQRSTHEADDDHGDATQQVIELRAFRYVAFGMINGDVVGEVNRGEKFLRVLRRGTAADDGDDGADAAGEEAG